MTSEANNYSPFEIHKEFQPEDLAGHYVLAAELAHLPIPWNQFKLGRWHLACEPRLPCFSLVNEQGDPIGCLLGFPIGGAGELLVDTSRELVVTNPNEIESWLYNWAGRWLAIFITADFERVYMDPSGSLCTVYSESAGIVATSSGLIPYSDYTGDRSELIAQMPILSQVLMYPLGMTPRYGVERLLPNHYLDLSTWHSHRYWPTNLITPNTDTETATHEIATLTKRHIAAVATRYPLQMSITAGQDSRAMLAAARLFVEQVEFFTTYQPTRTAELDVYMAKRIARDRRLNHRIIPHEAANKADKHLWLYRTGCSIGNPPSFQSARLIKRLDPDRVFLSGYIGEVVRYYYGKTLSKSVPQWDGRTITPEHLLLLSQAPCTEEGLARMTSWLSSVPLESADQILDLFYLEQRVGCWISVATSAFADSYRFELWPLNSRRIIELMLALPLEFKIAGGMHRTLIFQEWPELMDYPINESSLAFRFQYKASRFLQALKK